MSNKQWETPFFIIKKIVNVYYPIFHKSPMTKNYLLNEPLIYFQEISILTNIREKVLTPYYDKLWLHYFIITDQ